MLDSFTSKTSSLSIFKLVKKLKIQCKKFQQMLFYLCQAIEDICEAELRDDCRRQAAALTFTVNAVLESL